VSQLRHSYPAFRELNAEVLTIAAVGLKPLTAFARELELPFPVLSDASGEVYFAFGLGKGMVIRPHTLLAAARLVWHAKRLYRPVGDIMQVGGDFIVDSAGIVRYAHSGEDPTDRPEAAELLRLMGDLRSPARQ
jgi:peroxiredoxin